MLITALSLMIEEANTMALAVVTVCVWFVIALAVSAAGFVSRLPGPGMQVLIVGMTVLSVAAARLWPRLRTSIAACGPAPLVAVHLTRFVGFYFLWLQREGRLPASWATPAGYGDIAVAALACVLLALRLYRRRGALLLWNALGLADILFVVGSAARHNFSVPGSMVELTHLPLALLATFLVPLIICTHVIIFAEAAWKKPVQTA